MDKPANSRTETYVSEHPKKDWDRFKEAMRAIIGSRKPIPAIEGQESEVYSEVRRKRKAGEK